MTSDPPDDTASRDDFAALWSSDGVTRSLSAAAAGLPADLPFLFSAGQRFGGYAIVRPIGKGGMGQVYEAEEIDSGRRVALKLLSRGLGDDEERDRFLREGQLAGSLSHPHCVYVFGTSEIQGFPVIAMELVPDGTLKDRIVDGAPMDAAAAVDAVLQVIRGLEAAASIGILHRDVKPSNCFVHRDGRVLVGDFGLSVAAGGTDARGERAGTILGTPGFASPEQLRGEPLGVASDIYSVGATLFYLLAGRAPFDDNSTTSLLARVASEPPPSLTTLRPGLPRGLAAIVARCLAKTPAERYASYAALRDALEPFGSARLAAAPLLRRTLAGLFDAWIISVLMVPFSLFLRLHPLTASQRIEGLIVPVLTVVIAALYYGLLEGLVGAAAGKALFGLRVVDEHRLAPGVARAAGRALVFDLPALIVKELALFAALRAIPDLSGGLVRSAASLACLAILFSTARKVNGYLALHDRASGTRVVRRRVKAAARDQREQERERESRAAAFAGADRVGPYLVSAAAPLPVSAPVRIEAFDDRLERKVWIELLPASTPPLAAARRDLGRPARVRWLGGKRDGGECWDAYEAVDGLPLEEAAAVPQPWSRVRHWLTDLAAEVIAAQDDGSLVALDSSHVWIGRDDHARIFEWRPPGAQPAAPPDPLDADLASAQRFLYGVAMAALTATPFDRARRDDPAVPLPLPARSLLLSLKDARFASTAALAEAVSLVLSVPASYPRSKRALHIAACAALPVTMTVVSIGGIVMLRGSKAGDRALFTLDACLNELERAEKKLRKGPDPEAQRLQDDVGIYLAEHLAGVIEREETWSSSFPDVGARGGRARARRAVAAHQVRSPEEVRRADATVAHLLDDQGEGLDKLTTVRALSGTTLAIFAGTFAAVAVLAGLGALLAGSGFLFRAFGAALVNRRGQRISRLRALLRAAIVWTPVILLVVVLKYGADVTATSTTQMALELLLLAAMAAGAAWAIARPSRGLQDRIAGSWIVPR